MDIRIIHVWENITRNFQRKLQETEENFSWKFEKNVVNFQNEDNLEQFYRNKSQLEK